MGKKIIVDTYAILAIAYGELTKKREEVMSGIRSGLYEGIIPSTVVYEFILHWLTLFYMIILTEKAYKLS